MPLEMYKASQGIGAYTYDHTFENPILWEASPAGGVLELKVWLRMRNPNTEYCTEGRLFAVDSVGEDESGWFSFAAEESGGPGEYQSDFPFSIPLGSEVAVWIRLEVPEAVEIGAKNDVRLSATYVEFNIEQDQEV